SGVGAIKDSDAVAIGEPNDFAGEGIGEGRYGEKDEEAKGKNTGRQTHSLIPGIVNFKTPLNIFYSITRVFWLRSWRGRAVMYKPYDG
ncbi:MAG: hypothetical protein V3R24_08790, partial [Gemmatimonadales bacterium]